MTVPLLILVAPVLAVLAVAIKLARTSLEMGEEEAKRFEKLFLNEASLAGKLNHPNIVGVYDAVVEGDQRYIVMEYVPGGSLKKYCTETNLLPDSVEQVRLVDIVGLDLQADGGTHVASTKWIGRLEVLRKTLKC